MVQKAYYLYSTHCRERCAGDWQPDRPDRENKSPPGNSLQGSGCYRGESSTDTCTWTHVVQVYTHIQAQFIPFYSWNWVYHLVAAISIQVTYLFTFYVHKFKKEINCDGEYWPQAAPHKSWTINVWWIKEATLAQCGLMLLPTATAPTAGSSVAAFEWDTPLYCVCACVYLLLVPSTVSWVSFRGIWSSFITNASASFGLCQTGFIWSGIWPERKTHARQRERDKEDDEEVIRQPRCMQYSVQGKGVEKGGRDRNDLREEEDIVIRH